MAWAVAEGRGLALLVPAGELRDLQSGHFPYGPAVAVLFHGLLNNVLHLLDGAALSNEFPILITAAAIGLALAAILLGSAAARIFRQRHSAGLALPHSILARVIEVLGETENEGLTIILR